MKGRDKCPEIGFQNLERDLSLALLSPHEENQPTLDWVGKILFTYLLYLHPTLSQAHSDVQHKTMSCGRILAAGDLL